MASTLEVQPVTVPDSVVQYQPPLQHLAVNSTAIHQQAVKQLTAEHPTNYIDADVDTDADIPADSRSFIPLPHQQLHEVDIIRAIVNGQDPLDWPTIAGQPINEFQTPGLATMAFPMLFPYGKGDPTTKDRLIEVTLADCFKHLLRYGDTTPEGSPRWRFASHPRFPYWALNMKQRHQLLSQSKVYLQRTPADANLTVEQLRDMVQNMNTDQLMNRIQRYAAEVQGTNEYWFQRLQELRALFDQKGPPTFFWTLSAADNYWPELHALMPHPEGCPVSHSMRVAAIINNPQIADWFFTSKTADFIQHWLMGSLDAQWFWYCFEYQARGSTHVHGCAKLRNDPGLCSLVKKAAEAWLAERKVQNQEEPAYITLREEGKIAKAKAIAYADWLVTTLNDALPTNAWQLPQPHPSACQTPFDSNDSDYHDLVNSVQRHSRCSPAYCLRHKAGQETPTCRCNFPRELCEVSDIHFEELSNCTVRATLSTKRNDPRLNSHQRLMLQNWRANVDLQIIIDVEACARYMAKYAAKGEPKSMSATAIFATCVGKLSDHHNPLTALRSSMLRVVGERDFSAQETAHMLKGLPLYSCTYSFVCISLDGSCAIQTEAIDQDDQTAQQAATNLSLFDCYANRAKYDSTFPGITLLNLCTFVARYTLYRGEIRQCSTEVIVRTFPNTHQTQRVPLTGDTASTSL